MNVEVFDGAFATHCVDVINFYATDVKYAICRYADLWIGTWRPYLCGAVRQVSQLSMLWMELMTTCLPGYLRGLKCVTQYTACAFN